VNGEYQSQYQNLCLPYSKEHLQSNLNEKKPVIQDQEINLDDSESDISLGSTEYPLSSGEVLLDFS
jgi:hypothetical protein